jgi:plastocyanin
VALSTSGKAALSALLALAAGLVLSGSAFGDSDHQRVRIRDDCDPATFNVAIGPGTCVGNGRTTFQDFIAEFQEERSVDKWRFQPRRFEIDAGGTITAVNRGGEVHTFTEVPKFGNGCVPLLNTGPAPPVVDCSLLAATAVPPGGTRTVSGLAPGRHLFECLIHPWMRSVAKVEADDDDHGDHGDHGGRGDDDHGGDDHHGDGGHHGGDD